MFDVCINGNSYVGKAISYVMDFNENQIPFGTCTVAIDLFKLDTSI